MEDTKNIHSFKGFAKGKLAPVMRDSVPFGKFLTVLPTAPLVDAAPAYAYPMDGNDAVGCCVVAGWDHFRQTVTGLLTGTPRNFTQDQIWAFYKSQNPHFDPNGTAATNGPGSSSDCGMSIQIFLEYLQSAGLILGFAKIDQTNEAEMKAAVYLGLGIITGVVLDDIQMDQFEKGMWDYVAGSKVDGGHCIPLNGYAAIPDQMTCVTWGKLVNCTEAFVQKQMDEAWFVLMQEHVDHPDFRNHFDLPGFAQAVSEITGGKIVIPLPKENFTQAAFLSFYENTEYEASAMACYDAMMIALTNAGIMSPLILIGALATIRTEVGKSYAPVRENITMAEAIANYGGPHNTLGNIPGTQDGYTFRGGGLIQLTGRANYAACGAAIGKNLAGDPDLIDELPMSAATVAWFFKTHGIDKACNAKDWTTVRELVNGGTNGLGTFLSVVSQFVEVMS